jgi:hypothetical protein
VAGFQGLLLSLASRFNFLLCLPFFCYPNISLLCVCFSMFFLLLLFFFFFLFFFTVYFIILVALGTYMGKNDFKKLGSNVCTFNMTLWWKKVYIVLKLLQRVRHLITNRRL